MASRGSPPTIGRSELKLSGMPAASISAMAANPPTSSARAFVSVTSPVAIDRTPSDGSPGYSAVTGAMATERPRDREAGQARTDARTDKRARILDAAITVFAFSKAMEAERKEQKARQQAATPKPAGT